MKPVLALAMTALLSCSAMAKEPEQMKLSELKSLCDSSTDTAPAVGCKFYILGVFEGMQMSWAAAANNPQFCPPEGVDSGYMVKLVRVQLAADFVLFPEDKDMPAIAFVSAVFMKAYPCKIR